MPIITLTTDFGHNDYYLGALKGVLLSKLPELTIIDISHEVQPYDIIEAAYILKNCYGFYPADTLHVVCVNNETADQLDYLLVKSKRQWIMAPDNGLLSLMLDAPFEETYRLKMSNVDWSTFHHRLALQIKSIFENQPPGDKAKKTNTYRKALNLQPVTSSNEIRGTIVHVDRYGNLVTNIHQLLFEQICQQRKFCIYLKPNLTVDKVVTALDQTAVGESFSIFNAAGYLTFGVCKGNAASLHGLDKGTILQIQFTA